MRRWGKIAEVLGKAGPNPRIEIAQIGPHYLRNKRIIPDTFVDRLELVLDIWELLARKLRMV